MEQVVCENDIQDFLDKLRLFVTDLGDLEFYTSNEHFQYLIKTNNYSVKVSIEQLIANRKKELSMEHFQVIASSLENKSKINNIEVKDNSITEKRIKASGKILRNLIILSLIIGAIILVIYLFFGNWNFYSEKTKREAIEIVDEIVKEQQQPKSEAQLRQELYVTECEQARSYVDGTISYRPIFKNVLSTKVIGLKIKGRLENNASLATFKNFKIKITFLSKTGSDLFTRSFTVYDYISPKSQINFNESIEVSNSEYQDIGEFKWDIIKVEF
jgi:hypothetical protein